MFACELALHHCLENPNSDTGSRVFQRCARCVTDVQILARRARRQRSLEARVLAISDSSYWTRFEYGSFPSS